MPKPDEADRPALSRTVRHDALFAIDRAKPTPHASEAATFCLIYLDGLP